MQFVDIDITILIIIIFQHETCMAELLVSCEQCSIARLTGWIGQLVALATLATVPRLQSGSFDRESCSCPRPVSMAALRTMHLPLTLSALPQSLGQLAGLVLLDLSYSRALTQLPESCGDLLALQTLNLCNCSALTTLPESLGRLAALQTVDLSFCDALRTLPTSLGLLSELTMLNIDCCCSLTALPPSFAFLPDKLCFHAYGMASRLLSPPAWITQEGLMAIKAHLCALHKCLMLILASRRKHQRHPPPELWAWTLDQLI